MIRARLLESLGLRREVQAAVRLNGYPGTICDFALCSARSFSARHKLVVAQLDGGMNVADLRLHRSRVQSANSTGNGMPGTRTRVVVELSPREAAVVRQRFGVGGGDEHTLEEIGSAQGVSKAWIQQLEQKALRKLRKDKKLIRSRQ